jgi:TonB-linked SusC/RagA family outer membrane protein
MKKLLYDLIRVTGYSCMGILGQLLLVGLSFANDDPHFAKSIYERDSNVLNPIAIGVSGTVTSSSDGEGLPGINILVKGTSTGTVTDLDGNYSIEVPNEDDMLVFSSIGYGTQEIAVNGRTVIDVIMVEDMQGLEEVVVTALGIRKETKRLGYATVKVEPEEFTINRTPNFIQSLQGKVAGVNISGMATGAGGSSNIRIRGQSAFAGANQPLIVVDGIPISNNRQYGGTQGANNSDSGDGLLSINPDIIESMTVLKGGAAAALYGSRAKDGVIMITTKSSRQKEGLGVTWNSNFTLDRAVDDTDFQYEYGQGERGVRPTSPFPDSGVWSFGEKIEPGMTQILFDGEEVPYVPQKNQIEEFYDGGYTFTNTISIASGGEGGGFNLSLSQLKNDGITPNSGFDRYNASLGFTQNISTKFNVSGNLNYSREIHTNPPQIVAQDMTSTKTIYTLANTMPLSLLEKYQRDENGNEIIYSRFRNRTNPYLSVYDHFNNVQRDRIYGNITMRYNFTDWLYAQGRIGQDYFSREQELNFPSLMAGTSPAPPGFINGAITQDQRRFREINSDFLIGAEQMFNERFGVNLTLGGNIMYQRSDRNSIRGQDFIVPWLYTIANTRVRDPLREYSERRVNSLYGAVEFSYNDFLFLNATARNDWFSTLSPEERSVLYPSVSTSFVFSQAFPQLPDWLNLGKIRVAYSEVGSDTDVAPFSQMLGYNINSSLFQGPTSVQPLGSISTNVVPNPNLRPMRVKEYEVGFNVLLFDNLNFDFTYYNKLSIDQILQAAISNTSGYTSQLINVGESVNRGVEMLLNFHPVETEAFSWSVLLNGAYNTSEVLKLGLDDSDVSIGGTIRQVVGKPLGQIYNRGYLRDGEGRKIFNPNNGLPERTSEEILLGSAIPKWVGGITNTFNYKGLSMSALVDFKLGHDLISSAEFDFVRHGKHKKTLVGREEGFVIGDGVTPDGSTNEIQVPVQTFYEADARIREDFVYNAGFWKLRQLTIGYEFTRLRSIAELLPVQGLSLSAVANNVYTIKRWTENMDPEQVHEINGTQDIALPLVRSYGFNLRVQF